MGFGYASMFGSKLNLATDMEMVSLYFRENAEPSTVDDINPALPTTRNIP